jgi:hypothetical protein
VAAARVPPPRSSGGGDARRRDGGAVQLAPLDLTGPNLPLQEHAAADPSQIRSRPQPGAVIATAQCRLAQTDFTKDQCLCADCCSVIFSRSSGFWKSMLTLRHEKSENFHSLVRACATGPTKIRHAICHCDHALNFCPPPPAGGSIMQHMFGR